MQTNIRAAIRYFYVEFLPLTDCYETTPAHCFSTQPDLYTLPNQSWTLPETATATSNAPSNFNVGYSYPERDPTWPLMDYRLNDCWGDFTITVSDTGLTTDWNNLVRITTPVAGDNAGQVYLDFSDHAAACYETENTLLDANSRTCSDYWDDGYGGVIDCSGGDDGASGFDAS